MLLIENEFHHHPAVNLALEEYLTARFQTEAPVLLFYINDPAVVIGRNQVPFGEVNLGLVRRHGAAVVRRISGGGAVYHGPGNLNFCLIQSRGRTPFPSPGDAVRPVVGALKSLNLPADLNERHDILLEGRKVTGTAQYRTQGKCLTHGTLLVSADLDVLQALLASDSEVTTRRGRPSIPSPVTNLNRVRADLTLTGVREALVQAFAESHGAVTTARLSLADWADIRRRALTKYRSWDWTVGRSPEFQIQRRARLPWGWSEALISIRRGIVIGLEMRLPASAPAELNQLANQLEGRRYRPDDVLAAIQQNGSGEGAPGPLQLLADWLCTPHCWWR